MLLSALRKAWQDVEFAYNSGYLVNESMMAFVVWKAITTEMPDVQITYDARVMPEERFRPDLVVWRDGEEPSVLFVGELKFKPQGYPVFEEDIRKLSSIRESSSLNVLTRDPQSGEILERPISCGEDTSFGFLVVGRSDAVAVDYEAVSRHLSPEAKSQFHFLFGSVSGKKDRPSTFGYSPPSQLGHNSDAV